MQAALMAVVFAVGWKQEGSRMRVLKSVLILSVASVFSFAQRDGGGHAGGGGGSRTCSSTVSDFVGFAGTSRK